LLSTAAAKSTGHVPRLHAEWLLLLLPRPAAPALPRQLLEVHVLSGPL
jgi:hypothetical protein